MENFVSGLYLTLQRRRYRSVYEKFKDHTMVPQKLFATNLDLCRQYADIPGAIVECGTWKGGMIGAIAYTLGKDREYALFDSFEGLPPAREIDGPHAIRWQSNKDGPYYYDNCRASEQSAREAMELSGARNFSINKGWFADTLAEARFDSGIAILRMDADWYDPTTEVLNHLFPKVNRGGVIIVDDYYTWDGCSRAVHDYLSAHRRTERIYTSGAGVCYLVKKSPSVA